MKFNNQLYANEEVEHYMFHTIVTLYDRTDHDFSYIIKVGIHTADTMRSQVSGEPIIGTDYLSREAALTAAKERIEATVLTVLKQS